MSERETPRDVLCAALPRSQEDFIADSLLEALDAAGYVIVPKEPTFEMMEAALRAGVGRIYMPGGFERDADKYRAMLAASQQKGVYIGGLLVGLSKPFPSRSVR
jgi:hypothetical protein